MTHDILYMIYYTYTTHDILHMVLYMIYDT